MGLLIPGYFLMLNCTDQFAQEDELWDISMLNVEYQYFHQPLLSLELDQPASLFS